MRSYGSHCSAFVVPVKFALSVPSCGRTLSTKSERPVTVNSFSQTQNGAAGNFLDINDHHSLPFIIMPSLEKMSGTEILSIGKKMFYGGFALLPFLWLVNVIYLWPTLKRTDVPAQLRSCKILLSITYHRFMHIILTDCSCFT